MTDKEVRAFLERPKRLEARVRAAENQCNAVMRLTERLSPEEQTVSDILLSKSDEELKSRIQDLYRARLEVYEMLSAIEGAKEREVLELRYLCGMTWGQVQQEMLLGRRWMYRLHLNALHSLALMPDKNGASSPNSTEKDGNCEQKCSSRR